MVRHGAMQPGDNTLPRPYLSRAETNARLEKLGFIIDKRNLDYPPGFQMEMFVALQELIAGAIAEWVDLRDDIRDEPEGEQNNELLAWAEEWLVG